MPPSGDMRPPRPSAPGHGLRPVRESIPYPSFSRLTSSGQWRQLDRFKAESERSGVTVPDIIAGRYRVVVPFHQAKAMSSVYLAKDLAGEELVVIKMASEHSDLALSTLTIKREMRALSKLKHRNIVGLRSSGCWGNRDFLALEYLPGADLYTLMLDYGRFPWQTTQDIMVQVCDALAETHRNLIVHDDIKPENLIISRSDGIKATLLDFGLAKFMDDDSASDLRIAPGIVVGTFPYMAPETFDMAHYDHRADIHSLGVVLYEMLTGRNPFDGENIPEVVELILNHIPAPPGSMARLPEQVDTLVMRSLEKNPFRRFSSMEEMGAAIASCPP